MTLNLEQRKAVENGEPVALNVSGMECILVRKDVYLRREADVDAADVDMAPWTTEEMDLLADEAEAMISRMESP
jgi:hypothetical protein